MQSPAVCWCQSLTLLLAGLGNKVTEVLTKIPRWLREVRGAAVQHGAGPCYSRNAQMKKKQQKTVSDVTWQYLVDRSFHTVLTVPFTSAVNHSEQLHLHHINCQDVTRMNSISSLVIKTFIISSANVFESSGLLTVVIMNSPLASIVFVSS